jgi:hypothetical protein
MERGCSGRGWDAAQDDQARAQPPQEGRARFPGWTWFQAYYNLPTAKKHSDPSYLEVSGLGRSLPCGWS